MTLILAAYLMTRAQAFGHLKRAWGVRLFGCLVCILSLLTFTPKTADAQADRRGVQTLVYDLYAGGFHAVQATLEIDMSKQDRYSIVLDAHTRGLLGSLAPWEGVFESHGWKLQGNDYRPELHKSATTWRDETEIKEYTYNKDRKFQSLLITDHDKPQHKKEVEADLTDGSTDVLSATLATMQLVAEGQDCEGSAEVFDGKRRFHFKFNHEGDEELEATRYNIYQGPAVECTVEVVPVAGAWHKKPRGWVSIQEQGRERGTMPTIWAARISENGPAVPVKMRVKTDYGTLFMHLVEYKNGKEILVAEKRSDD